MTEFNLTREKLEKLTGEKISLSKDKRIINLGEMYADVLEYETGEVNHIGTRVKITFSSQSGFYCEFLYSIVNSASNNIAIIEWMKVSDKVDNNGIGRILRKEVVNSIGDKYKIYSKIVNENLFSVARDQGFRKARTEGLDKWFIKS